MKRRLLLRLLRWTTDAEAAARSRLVWGERVTPGGQRYYVLTPLGIINTVRERLGLRPWSV